MPRYILIDNNSSYIFADTADLPGWSKRGDDSIVEAARLFDESIGVLGRRYEELDRNPRRKQDGYDVYRVDVDGSDAVTVIRDGQDPEMIEAVMTHGHYQGFVACHDA